jgi:aryl-alcohol dehydrogenase-like predicted oxidoreductase
MITKKPFGRTGHNSSRTLFGGAALWTVSQEEADHTLEVLLEYGVNHIDTAASYGDSELRIGPWMRTHRKDFFLATKTGGRSYQQARDQLHASLERLKVDSVDLWQMHVLVSEEDWQQAMSPGGALDAFIEAKEQGLTRFLGVTGHGLAAPAMHMRSLQKYDFDAVLLPYNFTMMQNPDYAADFKKLSDLCREKKVAMQTIKSIARGQLGSKTAQHAVWYDPLDNEDAIDHAVKWVLGNEQVFLNTAGDIHLLPKVLKSASTFESRTSEIIMKADIQKYGITPLFTPEFSGL